MRFAAKLTALFSVIFLVIGVVVSYFVYSSDVYTIEEQVKDKLEDDAFHTMDKVDRFLFEKYAGIQLIAKDPVISSKSSTPEEITRRLKDYMAPYRSYASMSFFDLDRKKIAETAGTGIGSVHTMSEYWPGIASGKEAVFNLSKSEALNEEVLHFARVVRDKDNKPFGVVVSRVFIKKLHEITGGATGINELRENINIDLVDKKGLMLYSNYDPEGILKKTSPNYEKVRDLLAAGNETGSVRIKDSDGGESIYSFITEQGYQSFKGNGWALVMRVPAEEAFASAERQRYRIAFIFFAAGIVGFISIYIFSRTVSGPLLALGAASDEIGRGNYDQKVHVRSKDEIGRLAVSFNKMALDLKDYRDSQAAWTRELEQRNTEAELLVQMGEVLQGCKRVSEAHVAIESYAARIFSGDSGALYILDGTDDRLGVASSWGDKALFEGSFPAHECPALKSMHIYAEPDVDSAARCSHIRSKSGSCFCAPLIAQGESIGVLSLLTGGPDQAEVARHLEAKKRLAQTVAEQAGLAIANLRLHETLHEMSIRDPLTCLFNRRYMDEMLEREIKRSARNALPIGIIMIDIDHFKEYNDAYGHYAGDGLLRKIGQLLKEHVRGADIACRYGGEEFTVIMPDAALDITQKRAEELREAVKRIDAATPVNISLGVAVYPQHGDTGVAALKAADLALYRAKNEGRDRVCLAGQV